jgi:hypothetical protein
VAPAAGVASRPAAAPLAVVLALAASVLGPAPAAAGLQGGGTAQGHVRVYDYGRWDDPLAPHPTSHDLAVGGDLVLHSGALAGFSAALGFYTAHSLQLFDPRYEALAGPDRHLNALAEAYLQYQRDHVLVRAGRQLIDTPFAGPDLYTMLPRAFFGVAADVTPLPLHRAHPGAGDPVGGPAAPFTDDADGPHLVLTLAYLWYYESRFADGFTRGNEYTTDPTDGFFVAGLRFRQRVGPHRLFAHAWYYDFVDFAHLGYGEARYQLAGRAGLGPVVGFQLAHETTAGRGRLGPVSAQVYGVLVGVSGPAFSLSFVADVAPEHFAAFRHGGLVHPYNDLTGNLYTDTMNDGLEDISPGQAYGVKGDAHLFARRLTLTLGYVRYRAGYGFHGAAYDVSGPAGYPPGQPFRRESQWALDAGVAFTLPGALRGLTLQDTVGIRDAAGAPRGPMVENRLALVYGF